MGLKQLQQDQQLRLVPGAGLQGGDAVDGPPRGAPDGGALGGSVSLTLAQRVSEGQEEPTNINIFILEVVSEYAAATDFSTSVPRPIRSVSPFPGSSPEIPGILLPKNSCAR